MSKPTTPGVYIDEVNAFPNAVVEVPTAIPAFIGYTPVASRDDQGLVGQPVCITSMQDFEAWFTNPPPAKPYAPTYYVTKQPTAPAAGKLYPFNGDTYAIEPDPDTVYYLYQGVKMFYQNGGGTAYLVSLGPYGPPSGSPIQPGGAIINRNVKLADFQAALQALRHINEVTMYVAPESTLLADDEYATLLQDMLLQSSVIQTAMSILDVKGGRVPNPQLWPTDIANFRNWTGVNGLSYGAAYYPYLQTTAASMDEVDYTQINGGDLGALLDFLNPAAQPNPTAAAVIQEIQADKLGSVAQNNQALLQASTTYAQLLRLVLAQINTIPPSGVVAGLYSLVDAQQGVWMAPANVSPVGVTDLTIRLSDDDQADLNVDAVSGKSINAFRFFPGRGVLLWGARTLDGNSQDWRYINVRRTVTMIEQSVKDALRAYVFAPNNDLTWLAVKGLIENFLTNVWKQGALQGASPDDAFAVQVGLGETMTAQDILDGYLRVTLLIAVTHPAEFMELSIEQELAKS